MEVETSLPWPSSIPQLKRLDELLRCGICYEFMTTSMITACSHNYCSLCIRQYLSYKTQCPACFQETTTQHLRNNRLVDEIIGLFTTLRDKVARLSHTSKGGVITSYLETNDPAEKTKDDQAASGSNNIAQSCTSVMSPRAKAATQQEGKPASPKRLVFGKAHHLLSPRKDKGINSTPKRNLEKPMVSSQSKSPLRRSESELCSPSSSSVKSQAKIKSPSRSLFLSPVPASLSSLSQSPCRSPSGHFSIFSQSTSVNGESSGQDGVRVDCPVCHVQVPQRNINQHLDACLQRMDEEEDLKIIEQPPRRKPLTKLVYSLLSEKQMRQKVKDLGLSFCGDKQALVNRHRRYVTLYNAECDEAEPRPVQELVKQLDREEKEKSRVTTSQSIFTYNRKTAPEIIEKEQKNYIKKNNDHFVQLISDVKRRQKEAKKKRDLKKNAEEKNKGDQKQVGVSEAPITHLTRGEDTHSPELLNLEDLRSSNDDNGFTETTEWKVKDDKTKKIVPSQIHALSTRKRNTFMFSNNTTKRENNNKKNDNLGILNSATTSRMDTDELQQRDIIQAKDDVATIHHTTEDNVAKPPQEQESNERTGKDLTPTESQVKDSGMAPSPDIFAASPTSSSVSMSLLQDCDVLDLLSPAASPGHVGQEDDGEDLIPAHQSETCPNDVVEENEVFERTLSPEIGRRCTRAKSIGLGSHQIGLTNHNIELHNENNNNKTESQIENYAKSGPLVDDSQGDPEYMPSQLLESMDSEEVNFQIPRRQTRRTSKKRKEGEESTPSHKKGRKKRRGK
ncbi:E3 ubiquitin-protein ligase RAD18-like [Homarus americanus]|uniref:E3 ubiquitin-protein ligase RAD18-like n=1 Tax=Homarus americanus TaxID=6706 RepID=UPI001C46E362|nr:E3 ubiquitin-protein ligase RAD18-like [Homarus americanus]